MPFQKIAKVAAQAVKQAVAEKDAPRGRGMAALPAAIMAAIQKGQSGAAPAPRGRGMAGIPAAVMSAVQQGRGASSPEAERKKKIAAAVRKAAGAVARPLTLKKGGVAKKSTVKAKARKK